MTLEDTTWDEVTAFECGSASWHQDVASELKSGRAWETHLSGSGETLLYVTEPPERLIGYASVTPIQRRYPRWNSSDKFPVLHILWLGIASGHQRAGHGFNLVKALAARAISSDLLALDLLVHSENHEGIAAYEKYGFHEYIGAKPYKDPDTDNIYLRRVLPLVTELTESMVRELQERTYT